MDQQYALKLKLKMLKTFKDESKTNFIVVKKIARSKVVCCHQIL